MISLRQLNIIGECRSLHIRLWSCPPFLFVVMGIVNIIAMVGSYTIAGRFVEEPQAAALIVIIVSLLVFLIGSFIIQGFNQIVEANRIKSEFIAIVSHQLRSPLSIFKWSIDALEHHQTKSGAIVIPGPEKDSHSLGYFEILKENTEKMIQLVNMLLEVSRIEAGRMMLHREPVRLDVLTEDAVRSYARYARASNVVLDFASSVRTPILGDQEKLKMVVQNLIDNAIRYSRSGGRVVVTISPAGSMVEWKIEDQGLGITYEDQRKIFQKFFRAEPAVRYQAQGSGLGLYIARSVIAALDGVIGFSSTPEKGSTFWFRVPGYRGQK